MRKQKVGNYNMADKYIFLWGVSRSVSTAMLKAFQQRKDTAAILAPFNDTYYYSTDRYTNMYGDNPEVEGKTFAVTCQEVLGTDAPVAFMKEMAYSVTPYAYQGFLGRATNAFIFRDPRMTLASRKKERKDEIGEHEFGFLALKELWDYVSDNGGNALPALVDGEKLRKDPERVLRAFCEKIGLAFTEEMLTWQPGPLRDFTPREEQAQKRWHKQVNASTGFIGNTSIGSDLDLSILTEGEKSMLERAMAIYEELSPHSL
jgi:hypothetical protein